MNYKLRIKKQKNSGYTIIETMIAVALFLVVIMIGMGALLNANLLQRKSQDMRSIMDSLSFVMEDMARNLRTGYNYQCFQKGNSISLSKPQSCVDVDVDGWAIAFEHALGWPGVDVDQWVYKIDDEKIFKSTDGADNFVQLLSEEIKIDTGSSGFIVLGAEPPPEDKQQPFVIIRLVGEITSGNNVVTPFSLQTSVSQRVIDVAPIVL